MTFSMELVRTVSCPALSVARRVSFDFHEVVANVD